MSKKSMLLDITWTVMLELWIIAVVWIFAHN
jgi:hypothetical protein